jgi:hypothetical protein
MKLLLTFCFFFGFFSVASYFGSFEAHLMSFANNLWLLSVCFMKPLVAISEGLIVLF